MSDKRTARRGRKRRAKYDRAVFASPEAARLAGKVAEEFGLDVSELLGTIRAYDARPTGSGGQWRVGDIRAGLAAYERWQQEFSKSLEPLVDPALAAQRAAVGEAMDEFEYAVVCECGLYVPERDLERHRQEDCPGPAILPDSAEEAETDVRPLPNLWQRFTGWVKRQWDVLPDRRLPLPSWLSRPSWLRVPAWRPQFRRPQIDLDETLFRFEVWLTGENTRQAVTRTIAAGLTLGLVLLLGAGLAVWGIGRFVEALSPSPAPAPTQVAAAVPTTTSVALAAVATFTPVPPTPAPPTPEPLVFVTTDLPYGVVGREYEGTVVATGKGAVNFWGSPVHIPGLYFDWNTGALAGTPTQAGSFEINITAHDEAGQSLVNRFTVLILSPPPAEPEKPVEQEEPSPPPPPPPAAPVTTITVTGHIENGAGMEVVLFAGADIVASTMTDAGGNYIFTNITEGDYAVVVGEATPTAVTVVTGAETVTVPAFHRVVKGDTLWDIYGAHSWSDFITFADAHGLKHFGRDGKLIVLIQPGMVFNLAEMTAGG